MEEASQCQVYRQIGLGIDGYGFTALERRLFNQQLGLLFHLCRGAEMTRAQEDGLKPLRLALARQLLFVHDC